MFVLSSLLPWRNEHPNLDKFIDLHWYVVSLSLSSTSCLYTPFLQQSLVILSVIMLLLIMLRRNVWLCFFQLLGNWEAQMRRVMKMIAGGGLSITGSHTMCGDYLYSGHTVMLTLTYLFIKECKFLSVYTVVFFKKGWFYLQCTTHSLVTYFLICSRLLQQPCPTII